MEGKPSICSSNHGAPASLPPNVHDGIVAPVSAHASARQIVVLPDSADFLKVRIQLVITSLFKTYLCLTEEWTEDHDVAMAKLKAALPADLKQYVELADYLPDTKLDSHRNKVLRAGNNAIRELHEVVDSLRLD